MPKFIPIRVVKRIIEFVGSGDTDVDYVDSVNVGDAMSGTLGPFAAQDTADAADMLVVTSFNARDTVDASDQMGAITGLKANDSVAIDDRLAGTLGPVNAQDSLDLTDAPRVGPFSVQDSINISDAPYPPLLTAMDEESINISDAMAPIINKDNESLDVRDAFGTTITRVSDSVDISDFLTSPISRVQDSFDLGDSRSSASGTALFVDSIDFGDQFGIIGTAQESIDLNDNRSPVSFSGILWPNTTVSNTGWTNPGNVIDTNTGTAATCAATSSGLGGTGGTQNTTTCDLIISCANPTLSDWTISDVTIDWVISAAQSGTPLTAGQCNINYQYSLNDGTSWTTFFTQTALNGSTSSLSLGALTATQVNQLRFRAVGSVLSGTGLLPVTTTASWNFIRATITASKTY